MKSSNMLNRLSLYVSMLFCFLLVSLISPTSFAQQIQTADPGSALVWPSLPDEPKIKYIGAIGGTLDRSKKTGIAGKFICTGPLDAVQKPYGIALDDTRRVYLTTKDRVLVFDPQSGDFGCIGDKAGAGKLTAPIGIAVTKDRVLVGDIAAHRVFIYAPDGRLLHTLGSSGEIDSPAGIIPDERNKRLYVIDSRKHRVQVYSLDDYKRLQTIGSRGMGEPGKFNYPTNGAVDSRGNFYIVDTGNFQVQVFDPSGKYVKTIGKLGDMPGSLARPKGIAVDSEDHIYIVDTAFQNVQIFNSDGQILLAFGKGGWGPGLFTLPSGMVIDSEDRVYVVDQWPGNVQLFQYMGERYTRKQVHETERKKS